VTRRERQLVPERLVFPAAILAVAATVACAGLHPPHDEVVAAALEAEIRFVARDIAPTATPVFCIRLDSGPIPGDTHARVAERLQPIARVVGSAADCDAATIVVTAGPVEWIGEGEAEVPTATAGREGAPLRRRYRVVREADRWIALGLVMKMSPA
jgi:hypothetical protein